MTNNPRRTQRWQKTVKSENLYIYVWGNNEKRKELKGRTCKIIASGKKNSVMVKFIDNGQREIVSRRAIRKQKGIA